MREEKRRRFSAMCGFDEFGAYKNRWNILKIIIISNIAVFIIQHLLGLFIIKYPGSNYIVGFYGQLSWQSVIQGKIWHFITYCFVHADLLHIVFNLIIIWMCGRIVLHHIGTKKFALLYFGGAVAGAILHIFYKQFMLWIGLHDSNPALIGASAAGLALLLAFTCLLPNQRITILLFFVWPVTTTGRKLGQAIIMITIGFCILAELGNIFKFSIPLANIAHLAHLGGGLFGLFLMKYFLKKELYTNPYQVKQKNAVIGKFKNLLKITKFNQTKKSDAPVNQRQEIDRILEKINKSGIKSLSQKERQKLEDYSNFQ